MNKKHCQLAIGLAALVLLLTAWGGRPASAQTPAITWSVQPASLNGNDNRAHFVYDDLKPGQTVSDNVTVVNLSAQSLNFRVYASDAYNTPGGGFDLLAAAKPSVDVGTWIKFGSDTVTIPGRGRVTLPFTLKVPDNATPGDHSGGVVASMAGTGKDASGSQVAVDYRVGARVYLRVLGALSPKMSLSGLHTSYKVKSTATKGAMQARYFVYNTGNVRFSATPKLKITGPFGIALRTVALEKLPEILPGGVYEGHTSVSGLPPAVRITTQLVLDPHGSDGSPIADLASDQGSTSIWAVPWTLSGIALAILAAVAAYVFMKLRRNRTPALVLRSRDGDE